MKFKSLLLTVTMTLLFGLSVFSSSYAYSVAVNGSNDLGDPMYTGLMLNSGNTFSVSNITGDFFISLVRQLAAPQGFHARGYVSPDGTSSNSHFNQVPTTIFGQTHNLGTLVGQIGSNPWFSIGKNDYNGTAQTNGELKLMMWGLPSGMHTLIPGHQNYYELHCGGIKADVSQTPIPGIAWLLGSGIIGLVGLKRRKRGNL